MSTFIVVNGHTDMERIKAIFDKEKVIKWEAMHVPGMGVQFFIEYETRAAGKFDEPRGDAS